MRENESMILDVCHDRCEFHDVVVDVENANVKLSELVDPRVQLLLLHHRADHHSCVMQLYELRQL